MPAFIITRIQVGDYDTWRPMFDQDLPRARESSKTQRVFRAVDDPNHVFMSSSSSLSTTRRRQNAGSSPPVCSIGSRTSTVRTSWSKRRPGSVLRAAPVR